MNVLQIKAAVRERDGYRCTECGVTNFEHVLATNKSLEVHRIIPGSKYSIDGCVTLCRKCHGPKPKVPRDTGSKWAIMLELETVIAVKLAATKAGLGISELVNKVLRERFADAIVDAKKYVQKPQHSPKSKK